MNIYARRNGKSIYMKQQANNVLDAGNKVLYASIGVNVIIERVNGIDFIINEDGSRDIDGSNLLRCEPSGHDLL